GAIIGGEVYGAAGVDAAYVGNDVGVKTIVSAGVKDVYARQMKLYEKAIDSIDRTLVTLEEELDEAERSVRLGTADELMTKHVQSLRREKIQKTSEQKETTTKIEKLKTLVAGSAGAQIIVKNTAYNGSIFILGEQQYVVEEERRQIKFVIDDKDNMIIRPIV
nr:FapA family protein [Lachnospiraceae bacterium]